MYSPYGGRSKRLLYPPTKAWESLKTAKISIAKGTDTKDREKLRRLQELSEVEDLILKIAYLALPRLTVE